MSSKDNSMEKIMGFGNFGKKSRKFDFNKIFEETRRNAQERSKSNLEKIMPEKLNTSTTKDSFPNIKLEDSSSEDDSIGPLPKSTVKQQKKSLVKSTLTQQKNNLDTDSDSSEVEDEEVIDPYFVPSTHEIVLSHGVKPVQALAVEPSGSRLVTSALDFDMKYWDFAGMDKSCQSFRELTPCECHNPVQLQFNCTGEHILVCAANAQAKVYDRDGYEKLECVKGDQYLTDMFRTTGHTTVLNGGTFHPQIRSEFLTCSNDGTVRTWDMKDQGKKCRSIWKCKDKSGRRTQPTCCAYSRDGKQVAAACNDGSLMFFDAKRTKTNPTTVIKLAHTHGSETSSIEYCADRFHLCTRGGDDTVKLWDVRKLKDPVATATDLLNDSSVLNCTFSPNTKMLVTGVSVPRNAEGKQGKLIFLDKTNLEVVNELALSEGSVLKTVWNDRINQIFATTSTGDIHVLYDVDKSIKGAKLCVVKKRKKINQVEMMVRRKVITPYSLPLYREDRERSTKKQMEKDRKDHVKSHRPQPPLNSRGGAGGRIKAHGSTLASFVMKSIAKDKFDDSNPREAILRHAEEAAAAPQYVSHAYKETQPNTIFEEEESSEDEDAHIIIGANKRPDNSGEPSSKRSKH